MRASRRMGELIAQEGHLCVNGAGKNGCMGALNAGCLSAGGHVRGVIHERWVVDTDELQKGLHELIMVGATH